MGGGGRLGSTHETQASHGQGEVCSCQRVYWQRVCLQKLRGDNAEPDRDDDGNDNVCFDDNGRVFSIGIMTVLMMLMLMMMIDGDDDDGDGDDDDGDDEGNGDHHEGKNAIVPDREDDDDDHGDHDAKIHDDDDDDDGGGGGGNDDHHDGESADAHDGDN